MSRTIKKKQDRRFNQLAISASASRVLLTRTTVKPNGNGDLARVPIRAGHCSGCNMRIPSGQLQRVLAGQTIQCEHCRSGLHIEKN